MLHLTDPAVLGSALRQARKNLELTQETVAMVAGVGLRFIVELEAGKSTVQLGLVLKVIEVLGAQVWFKGLDEQPLMDVPGAS